MRHDADAGHLGLRLNRRRGGDRDVGEIDVGALEPQLSGHASRDVEQILDEARLEPRALFDGLERELVGLPVQSSLPKHLDPAEDRCHGGSELVRDHREECVAGARREVRLAVKARVLDGERRPTRDLLREIEIVRRIGPLGLGPHERHHAENFAPRAERDAHVGMKPEVAGEPVLLLGGRRSAQHLLGDARDQLGLRGSRDVVRADRRVPARRILLLHLVGEGHLAGIDVMDRDAPDRPLFLDEIDRAPVREPRHRDSRDFAQRLLAQ